MWKEEREVIGAKSEEGRKVMGDQERKVRNIP